MKFKIFFLALVAIVTSSCEKLLEPDPNKSGFDLVENSYTNYRGALQGINGIYATQRQVYANIWFLDELSDDTFGGQSRITFDENNLLSTNDAVANLWRSSYFAIVRTNIFLDRIPAITGLSVNEEILKNQFIAEAKLIRALMYFNLVRLYGDVPLILTEQKEIGELQVPRTAANLVYEQIIKDLTEANAELPAAHPTQKLVQPVPASLQGGRERGRVTSILAKVILGHVYLTRNDFANADTWFTQALTAAAANGVVLNSNFNQNFEALSNVELSAESLFEIGFVPVGTLAGAQHALPAFFGPFEDFESFGWNAPTDKTIPVMNTLNNTLAEAFTAGDLRRNSTIKYRSVEYPGSPASTINGKHWVRGGRNQGASNWPVYRLADLILMAAEAKQALNQDPQALDLLNRVHAHPRTGLPAYPATLTGVPLRDAIRLERRLELALEAKRYFDLLRWGNLTDVMQAHGFPVSPVKNGLLPIPEGELQINTNLLPQNAGY